MQKIFFAAALSAIVLAGCDVRRHDRIAQSDPLQQQAMLKDPTTVQIIDSAFDFGKIAEGATVEYNYRFKNTGSKSLVINTPTASCGCTIPEKPDAPILPGDTGFIKVKFNSEHHPGKAHKIIYVTSNANPAFPDLLLTGDVEPKSEN